MDKIAKGKAADREALFQRTASRKKINPMIIEKDFWDNQPVPKKSF